MRLPEAPDPGIAGACLGAFSQPGGLLLAERRIPLSGARDVGQSLGRFACLFWQSLRNAAAPGSQ
jgi:hypothetical protein